MFSTDLGDARGADARQMTQQAEFMLARLQTHRPLQKIVFAGTSLSITDASRSLGCEWDVRGPIRRTDIDNIIENHSKGIAGIIAIIDGLFFGHESVSLTEIRDALDRGWCIIGCSSMGAIRALEARPIGMIGFGRVYRWLSLFHVEDDDEIAQSVDPMTFGPVSDALVDIRAFASSLVRRDVITRSLAKSAVERFKEMYFPDRLLSRFDSVVGADAYRSMLIRDAARSFTGLKRRDADDLIAFLRQSS